MWYAMSAAVAHKAKRVGLCVAVHGAFIILAALIYYWDWKEQKERREREPPECEVVECERVWRM